jgi:class 3 adenylate cyclase
MKFIRPSDWALRWKIAAAIWLLAFLPALAALSYFYSEARSARAEAQAAALHDAAARIAGQMSQLIADTGRMNAFLALSPELARLLAGERRQTEPVLAALHRVIVAHRDVELIMVMDRKGEVLTSTDPDLVGRNFGFRDYFKLAVQGRPHVTGFVVGAASGNTGVFFSHPVTARDGKVVGTVVTKLLAKAFVAMAEAERRSNAQTAFLLDADGVVVYHPSSDWVWRSLVPLPEKAQAAILADRRYRLPKVESLDIPSLHEAVTRYRSDGSVRWLSPKSAQYERAGYVHLPAYNWTVVVSSEERYLALAQSQLERALFAALGALLLSFGGAFLLLLAALVRPLRGIRAAAQRIARGEFRGAAAGSFGGELGEIAGALDLAAEGLQRRRREQQAAGRVLLPEIRHKLLPRRPEGGSLARLAVVYCALEGVHELLESRPASEALAALGDYAEQVGGVARPWGGQINHIDARSIVVVLAAPLADGDLESRAVSAALAIQRRLAEFGRSRAEAAEPLAQAALGVCSAGILVTGAVSAYERYLNSMLADGVNVAGSLAEIAMQTEGRPVMINHTTYVGVRNRTDIATLALGQRKLRGRAEPSDVYGVAFGGRPPPASVTPITGKA